MINHYDVEKTKSVRIEAIKRKSEELLMTKDVMAKEKQENLKRLVALKNELENTVDIKTIDKYLEDCIAKDSVQKPAPIVLSVPNTTIIEDDQQSTSTASEAEEEDLKAAGNAMYRLPDPSERNASLRSRLPSSESYATRVDQFRLQGQAAHSVVSRSLTLQRPLAKPKETAEQPPAVQMTGDARRSFSAGRRSSVKMYTRSGRSATPSPPSNVVSFFPRFTIGSGGSPPLHSSDNDTSRSDRTAAAGLSSPTKPEDPAATKSGSRETSFSFKNQHFKPDDSRDDRAVFGASRSVERVFSPTTTHPHSTVALQLMTSSEPQQTPSAALASSALPRGAVVYSGVSLHSFSGYQVKVKYVNPTDTIAPSLAPSQAHIPMKKRHFEPAPYAGEKDLSKRLKLSSSYDDTSPKLTSLYVGASAGFLGLCGKEGVGSASDNESDRDSPMFSERQRSVLQTWRKTATAVVSERGGKEWTDYRGTGEKKKAIFMHSYEAPTTKTTSAAPKLSEAGKPKATFSLWDRKHHAITMTTATNWRGKQQQQLIAGKAKTTVPPFGLSSSATAQTPHSATQVCYTTLKSSKPTVLPSLMVSSSGDTSKDPQPTQPPSRTTPPRTAPGVSRTAPAAAGAAVSQPVLKVLDPTGHGANRVVQVVSQAAPVVQPLPISAPSNAVAYNVVPYFTAGPVGQPTSGTTSYVQPLASASVAGVPNFGYIMNNTIVPDPKLVQPNGKPAQIGQPNVQMPVVVPIGYVMYPPGAAAPSHGIQLASLHPQQTKVIAPPAAAVSLAEPSYPALTPTASKRSQTPSAAADRSRSRVGSADSGGSSTISADSTDDTLKKSQTSSRDTSGAPPAANVYTAAGPTQFVIPGNHGFVMANSQATPGYTIPINLLGYPFQTYAPPGPESRAIQAVQMASFPAETGQGQVWAMNHGLGLQLATGVAVTTPVTSQQPANNPIALQVVQTTVGQENP